MRLPLCSLLLLLTFVHAETEDEPHRVRVRPSTKEKFAARMRHRLVPLTHLLHWFRHTNKPIEYHSPVGRLQLDGPDEMLIQVCGDVQIGLPCKCPSSGDGPEIDCKDETLKTTNVRPVYDSQDGKTVAFQVQRVVLSGNAITELWQNKIVPGHASTIRLLDLSDNRIIYIGDHAFSGMVDLVTLDLSFNRLAHLSPKVFVGSDGLEWALQNLYLDHNNLRLLGEGIFDQLTALNKLILDDNLAIVLTDKTFGSMNQLHELSLERCGLHELPEKVFEKMEQLDYLSLRGNPLLVVPPSVKTLHSLYILDISATLVSRFNEDALTGEYKLKILLARDMPFLETVDSCAFCGLPLLEEVILYNNSRLHSLHSNAFGDHQNIKTLDVEQCNLTTLDANLLNWPRMSTLKLGSNPYHCDCRLSWMTDQSLDLTVGTHTPACRTPSSLYGRPLNVLRERQLCQSTLLFTQLLPILSLLLLVSIGLLFVWYLFILRGHRRLHLSHVFTKSSSPQHTYAHLVLNQESTTNDDYDGSQPSDTKDSPLLPAEV